MSRGEALRTEGDEMTMRELAQRVVDAAGAAGGIDEIRRLAERGWPADRDLDHDSPELRAAIQREAQHLVRLHDEA